MNFPPADAHSGLLELCVVPPDDAHFSALLDWIVPDSRGLPSAADQRVGTDLTPASDRLVMLRAERRGRICGAIVACLRADRTADGAPPRIDSASLLPETAALLLSGLHQELVRRGVSQTSISLPTDRPELASCLRRAGYQRTHDLLILAADTHPADGPPPLEGWRIRPCDRRLRSSLRSVLAASFVDSLDFPDLTGGSSLDSVLDRFAQTGESGEQLWYLVDDGSRLAGCLLLSRQPAAGCCELVYMGLAPAARGRGGGLRVVRHACWRASQIGCEAVFLGVDAENDPAVAVYAAAGFVQAARRQVFFRRLPSTSDVTSCQV